MDENEYKLVRGKFVRTPCAFEKSILALKTQCSKATKKNIAEREVVTCASTADAKRCTNWLSLLRQKSQFALKISGDPVVLPHAKEMKVQVGGMLGLCKVLEIEPGALNSAPNIFQLLQNYAEKTTELENISFTEIVQEVAHFRSR